MSVATHAPILIEDGHDIHYDALNEMGDVEHAVQPITELLCRASPNEQVRLHCTLPTWNNNPDFCLDMHDFHDLRNRSLDFIHNLVKALRAVGVPASYTLAPSDSPLCLVCASHAHMDKRKVQMSAFEAFEKYKPTARQQVLLVDLQDGPALVIT
ncbi:hypothetical protein PENSPDRAFT_645275 [Peniophora sp. CONT]|nr:hypothetical protein PENSPDRAFT_645275 [Peniophora sp. CONT]